jgi:hypothetical protein
MDTNRVNELKHILLIDNNQTKEVELPINHWLENDGTDLRIEFQHNEVVMFNPFEKEQRAEICTENDLREVFASVGLDLNYTSQFRLELKETKKWGVKPLFINGTNTICFLIKQIITEKHVYFLLFNTDGTKAIESFYLHGLWAIERK